jgi:CcmD family protein
MCSNLVVMIVSLIVWIGIFFYVLRLDRKVKDLKSR